MQTQNLLQVDKAGIQILEPPCTFYEQCTSPSRGKKWACSGHKTDEDRILMCTEFHRFLNGLHDKGEENIE
jgi:hypothetical protein